MKKIIAYTEEQVLQMKYILNAVTVTGIQNAKQVAALAQMLDSGIPGEIKEFDQRDDTKNDYVPRDWETRHAGNVPVCKEI